VKVLLYRVLLRLLPRRRRHQYGDEMALVFASLADETRRTRGWLGVGVLWMKEIVGLAKFSARERASQMASDDGGGRRRSRWDWRGELRWSWRSLRARRWRAVFAIALLAATLAANTIVFSAADSLVFRRLDFPDADRLVVLQGVNPQTGRTFSGMPADIVARWRVHRDLFAAVHAFTAGSVLLAKDGAPESARVTSVTAGLLEQLGARPRAGRLFTEDDVQAGATTVAIVREDLARELFGDAAMAIGRSLPADAAPLQIVGVLPTSFRFQSGTTRVWRLYDLSRRDGGRVPYVTPIATLAPGMGDEDLRAALRDRSGAISAMTAAAGGWPYIVDPWPLLRVYGSPPSQLMWLLIGAAACLLLTCCASLASIEIASATGRARTYAIATALGAGRGGLVRSACVEGAAMVAAAVVAAAALAWVGMRALATVLPPTVTSRSPNAIDLDWRALAFMTAIATIAWLVATWPLALFASRAAAGGLRLDTRTAASPRIAATLRRGLATFQIAAAVCLVIGGTLGLQSYLSQARQDPGFDARHLARVSVTLPSVMPKTPADVQRISTDILTRLRSLPTVVSAAVATAGVPPDIAGDLHAGPLEIDGRATTEGMVILSLSPVGSEYLKTLGLSVRSGRMPEPTDPETAVVVTESFARQFWPTENAIGRRFRHKGRPDWFEIVGITPRIRTRADSLGKASAVEHPVFLLDRSRRAMTGPATMTFVARLSEISQLNAAVASVRAIDSRLLIRADVVDDLLSDQVTEARAAALVVTGFGTLAFVIAIAGVYGVMSFLVAGRVREIGIRVALGAAGRDVRRDVVGSALRFIVVGAVLGVAGAWFASRFAAAQLFAVSPTDPPTYALVTGLVIVTAVAATWSPARRAARVDPVIALRAE
jgi:putative ABC transport system permease protein